MASAWAFIIHFGTGIKMLMYVTLHWTDYNKYMVNQIKELIIHCK